MSRTHAHGHSRTSQGLHRAADVSPSSTTRSQSWVRLQSTPRHGELLQPGAVSSRSIFFTGMLLRANGEPC